MPPRRPDPPTAAPSADPRELFAEWEVDDSAGSESSPRHDDTGMIGDDPADHAGTATMLVIVHGGDNGVDTFRWDECDQFALVGDVHRVEPEK